jgi:hypothetical protein
MHTFFTYLAKIRLCKLLDKGRCINAVNTDQGKVTTSYLLYIDHTPFIVLFKTCSVFANLLQLGFE